MIVYIETYKLEPNTNQSEPKAETKPNPKHQIRTQSRKIDIKFIQVL